VLLYACDSAKERCEKIVCTFQVLNGFLVRSASQ
jgi:hypothetical protein